MKKLLMLLVAAGASAVFADLPTPMVWFDMKEMNGEKVKDASGNGWDLTLGPTVEIVDEPLVGKALKVTGKTTDWATFSCPVVTNTTISFWLRRDAQDSSILDGTGKELNNIPYVMSTGYSGFGINYGRGDGNISLIDQQNSPQTNFTGANPKRGEWHHMAFAVSYSDEGEFGTLTCRSYLDGTFAKETVQANNKAMRLPGKQNVILLNNAAPGNRPTSGLYADFRFYNTCLSAEEVRSVVMSGAQNRLVMRYAFDEISASVDGNGRHTTPEATGYASSMTLGKNMSLVDDGVEGKALRFMATSEVGGLVTSPAVPLAERTYSVWVRLSSRCKELNAISANPYPRLFNEHRATAAGNGGYCIFSDCATHNRGFNFMPSGCGTTAKSVTSHGVADLDVWSHLTIVERYDAGGPGGVVDFYVNGEPAAVTHTAYDLEILQGSIPFQIGNTGVLGNRYFCGDMDEFRLYNYALSADEVRRLYRGLAKIDAGDDFTVAGAKGVLHGSVAANAGDNYRKGYAGELAWSLVSAPEGGEGAAILQPHAAETSVALPVAGAYVFRLTISDLGVSKSDDVTVTSVSADGANAVPTVSVAASAQAITQPDAVTLTATVTDDDKPSPAKTRVRWAKTSGPGGVWFEPDDAAVTKASFGAAGAYVLTCTADDGQMTASADVTVVVADRADGKALASDMIHYWSLDSQSEPYSPDGGSSPKALTTLPDYNLLRYVPGKVGNGARAYAYSGAGAYWTPNTSIEEVAIDDPDKAYASSNLPPKNDYLTVSAWVYIDPEDENLKAGKVVGANVVGQGYTFGLRYNEKWSPNEAVNEGGFTLYQQGRNGSDARGGIAYCMVHYPVPNPSPLGRWLHICGIWARNVSDVGPWEMWYDGVKQTASRSFGANRGRINGNKLMIGGLEYTGSAKNGDGSLNAGGSYNANWPIGTSLTEFYTRTFPGIVDEVRIWTRKLTPEEIRFLAANPIVDANRGPSVDAPTAESASPAPKTPTTVAVAAFADKLPVGGTLSYAWSVISGDASFATFGDATQAETTFTARKKGTYVLQLAVSDGERTVCSKPLVLEVPSPGLVIMVK